MNMLPFKLKKSPAPLERHDQAAYFKWLYHVRLEGERVYDFAYAIPNGSFLAGDVSKRAIQGNALRTQGVKAGVPDVCLAWPRGVYHGLYIEFKRKGGVPSDVSHEQMVWIERLRFRGYSVQVAYGLDQAIAITREYLGIGR